MVEANFRGRGSATKSDSAKGSYRSRHPRAAPCAAMRPPPPGRASGRGSGACPPAGHRRGRIPCTTRVRVRQRGSSVKAQPNTVVPPLPKRAATVNQTSRRGASSQQHSGHATGPSRDAAPPPPPTRARLVHAHTPPPLRSAPRPRPDLHAVVVLLEHIIAVHLDQPLLARALGAAAAALPAAGRGLVRPVLAGDVLERGRLRLRAQCLEVLALWR